MREGHLPAPRVSRRRARCFVLCVWRIVGDQWDKRGARGEETTVRKVRDA